MPAGSPCWVLRGYTLTHQVIADVRQFGGGLEVARRLERANVIANKNLIPGDRPEDWDHPGGLRMGAIETTRLGMKEDDMATVADFIARVLVEATPPEQVVEDVIEFRQPFQDMYYSFAHGLPPSD